MMSLATRRKDCERTWNPKILVVQDEVSLFPAMVENMLLYRTMRSRQVEHELPHERYGDVGELMGCLLYTSPSPRDKRQSRMPSSA